MYRSLDEAAKAGIGNRALVTTKGCCEEWVRQVRESWTGPLYDKYNRGSAAETGRAFAAAGFAVDGPEQPGDMVFKLVGSGNFGHVGIVTDKVDNQGRLLVAENSSISYGRVLGAQGYRALGEGSPELWGHVDLIVRLPGAADPVLPRWAVHVSGVDRGDGVEIGGHVWVAAYLWCEWLGIGPAGFDDDAQQVIVGGRNVAGAVKLIGGHAFMQVTDLAAEAGLVVSAAGQVVNVTRAG
jgi:hypothetical protein